MQQLKNGHVFDSLSQLSFSFSRDTGKNQPPDFFINQYLKELGKFDLLTPEQEFSLAKSIHNSAACREQFINANLRLVLSVAKGFLGRGLDFMQLIEAGNEGLVLAADRFDFALGKKFSTYAPYWIRQRIIYAIKAIPQPSRLPNYMHERIYQMKQASIKHEARYHRVPSQDQVFKKMALTPQEIDYTRQALQMLKRNRVEVVDNEEAIPVIDIVEDPRSGNAIGQYLESDTANWALKLVRVSSPKAYKILEHRFGLNGKEFKTTTQLGEDFNQSRETIRKLHHETLDWLQGAVDEGRHMFMRLIPKPEQAHVKLWNNYSFIDIAYWVAPYLRSSSYKSHMHKTYAERIFDFFGFLEQSSPGSTEITKHSIRAWLKDISHKTFWGSNKDIRKVNSKLINQFSRFLTQFEPQLVSEDLKKALKIKSPA